MVARLSSCPAPGIHVSAHAAKNENVYSVGRRPAERGAAASAAETRTPLRITFALASRVILESVFNRACRPTSKCLCSDELPFLYWTALESDPRKGRYGPY